MELQLALVCDHAKITDDGKLDVHGVFNDLYAPAFPALQDHMVFVLAVEWSRNDSGRYRFRVELTDPDGKPTLSVEGHTDVDSRPEDRPPARTRLILPLDKVVFPKPGAYKFKVQLKGKWIAGPSLHLMHGATPPDPEGA
ncbi:MAG: hypothetical protein V3T24_10665 [Longimicrobiales bacterium]